MEFDVKLEPMLYGFYKDEGLELGERLGMALACQGKYGDLGFDKYHLPRCGFGSYLVHSHHGDNIGYEFSGLKRAVADHPEHEELYNTLSDKFGTLMCARSVFGDERIKTLTDAKAMWGNNGNGHVNPDFGRVVNLGTDGIREIIEEAKKSGNPDSDWFYRGCSYALDALDSFGERYCAIAKEKAASEADPKVRKYYEDAARAFEVVPKKPAYDFTSAVHAFWLAFTADGSDSPGRFDQYMYRAWEITENKDDAREILERLWDAFHDTRTWNLCLAGSDEEWRDEANELTYEILRLAREKKYNAPNITLRVHRNTPEKLWDAITDTLASGIGMPALYNDEVVCPALEKIGIPQCDSHDYCMNGCNQIDIMGKSHMGLEDGEVNFAKCLEYALFNGVNPMNGMEESLPTGDLRYAKSYEEVERAFTAQLDYMCYVSCATANNGMISRAIYGQNPLTSCLIEGCLETGRDFKNGGPLYNHGQILAEGAPDTGDSLWAIKKLVFDEKKYTMGELLDALSANFEGYDELYYDFKNCEKFGNDHDGVDEITARIMNRFLTVLKRHHTYRGGVFTGGCSTYERAAQYGRSVAALPNGKKRGESLFADSIAAVPGCDTHGPTACMKSVLKYNHGEACSGFVFQIKFDKKLFVTEDGKRIFKGLAKAYFAGGGQQYTVTVVSPEDLIAAQKDPERYKNLIVRVGGYSDYFVDLGKGLQENIIARTTAELK